jgi:hypothetical protein
MQFISKTHNTSTKTVNNTFSVKTNSHNQTFSSTDITNTTKVFLNSQNISDAFSDIQNTNNRLDETSLSTSNGFKPTTNKSNEEKSSFDHWLYVGIICFLMAITILVVFCLCRKSYKISIIENCLLNTIAFSPQSNSGEDKSIE